MTPNKEYKNTINHFVKKPRFLRQSGAELFIVVENGKDLRGFINNLG